MFIPTSLTFFTSIWALIVVFVYFTTIHKNLPVIQKIIVGSIIYIASLFTNFLALSIFGEEFLSFLGIAIAPFIFLFIFYTYILLKPRAENLTPKIEVQESQYNKQNPQPNLKSLKHESPSNIFICYRRADSDHISGRIYDRLSQHFGENAIFKDVDSVPLGVDFRFFIDDVISKCQILLVIIGDQWISITDNDGVRRIENTKDYVRLEIESALKRNIPIIPLLVGKATIPAENDLPIGLKELAFRNGTSIRPDPDFHNDISRLITSLELHLRNLSNKNAT